MNEQKGKKFFSRERRVRVRHIPWITLRELAIYLVLPAVIGFIVLALSPHNVWLMLFKMMIILIVLIINLAFLSSRPIRYRPNIRFQDYLKLRTDYKQRQKLFYMQRKKERFFK